MEQLPRVRSTLFGSDPYVQAVSETIIKGNPKTSWAMIVAALADPNSSKDCAIWHWLSSDDSG